MSLMKFLPKGTIFLRNGSFFPCVLWLSREFLNPGDDLSAVMSKISSRRSRPDAPLPAQDMSFISCLAE